MGIQSNLIESIEAGAQGRWRVDLVRDSAWTLQPLSPNGSEQGHMGKIGL